MIPAKYLGVKQGKITFAVVMKDKKGYLHYEPQKFHPIPQFVSIGDEGTIINNRFYAGQVIDFIEVTPSISETYPVPVATPAIAEYTANSNNNETPTVNLNEQA